MAYTRLHFFVVGLLFATWATTLTTQDDVTTSAHPTTTKPATTTSKPYHNVLDICASNGAAKFASKVRTTPYLSQLVDTSGAESNSSLTVFAFTDTAYSKAPKAFQKASGKELEWALEYHVALGPITVGKTSHQDDLFPSLYPTPPDGHSLPLQDIRINQYSIYNVDLGLHTVLTATGAEILKANIPASNGIVHIIGKVMYPIPTGSNLPKFLAVNPQLSTLNFYLKNSSIIDSLATDPSSPLTLFAPTDAAFAKLTAAQKEKLKDKKTLSRVLTYHVIPSALYNAGMYDNQMLKALSGDKILIQRGIGGTSVAGKMITKVDVTVTNGVVHELAEVMFPPGV